jgi:hypothetical protein
MSFIPVYVTHFAIVVCRILEINRVLRRIFGPKMEEMTGG